ncbi:MAG: hypothetical protein ACOCTT_04305 [archaeon]
MNDLKCERCGVETTYSTASCWAQGKTEDGEDYESNCDHEFNEIEREGDN